MPVGVIVIEPDDAERGRIAAALSEMHFRPGVFASVESATTTLGQSGFDLAIISYEGDGCGLPLAVRLSAAQADEAAPACIVVADRMCATLKTAAQELGLSAVLQRPVTARALAAAIEAPVLTAMERRARPATTRAIG